MGLVSVIYGCSTPLRLPRRPLERGILPVAAALDDPAIFCAVGQRLVRTRKSGFSGFLGPARPLVVILGLLIVAIVFALYGFNQSGRSRRAPIGPATTAPGPRRSSARGPPSPIRVAMPEVGLEPTSL